MQYTAGQAAKAAGVATSTITNALKSGKISGQKDDNGAWRIDPAELHRVFPPKERAQAAIERGAIPAEMGQERIIALLEAQLADVRAERDSWRAQAERLALRLPATVETVPVEPQPARPRPSWIARIFGAR
jgi:hypothetical protein